jgi:hypothetical protein
LVIAVSVKITGFTSTLGVVVVGVAVVVAIPLLLKSLA